MEIDAGVVAVLAVAALASSIVLGVVVVVLCLRLRALAARQRRVFPRGDQDVVSVLEQQAGELDGLAAGLVESERAVADLGQRLASTVSRVGLKRYDAFDDMGGAVSFSAAFLDAHGTGVVLSAINGRAETRCYAKPVVEGASEHNLSADEADAIADAMRGPLAVGVPQRRRRRAS